MGKRAKFLTVLVALTSACSRPPGPIVPGAITPSPAVKSVAITGLPAPLLFDIPPSVKAGRSYPLTAIANLDDGSNSVAKASAVTWSTTDPLIASFEGNILQAHQPGGITITAVLAGGVTTSRVVSVRSSATIVREERAERIPCERLRCPYPFCPFTAPYWLFPVYEDGIVELISVQNPGWGSPHNQIIQLSPAGEKIGSFPFNIWAGYPEYRTVHVRGGFMYVLIMEADLMCGNDAAAVWTHPN